MNTCSVGEEWAGLSVIHSIPICYPFHSKMSGALGHSALNPDMGNIEANSMDGALLLWLRNPSSLSTTTFDEINAML